VKTAGKYRENTVQDRESFPVSLDFQVYLRKMTRLGGEREGDKTEKAPGPQIFANEMCDCPVKLGGSVGTR
jgi:hypothetical protein